MHAFVRVLPNFLLAFLVGVFIASIFVPPEWFLVFLGSCSALLLVVSISLKKKQQVFMLVFIFLGIFTGMLRFTLWSATPNDAQLTSRVGMMGNFEGVVTAEPDVREGKTHLTVTFQLQRIGSISQEVFGTALLIVNRYPQYHYGDRLEISGKLALPQVITEDDGRVFDYPKYLRSKGIHYQMLFPKLTLINTGEGNTLIASLLNIKSHFENAIGHALPSPESSLLSGLLLGGKQSLGKEWLERFRAAGIIHIIVLSGYNMTIVAEWIVVLFRFLGFYGSLSSGAVGIVLFALMTGGGATVLRAAIMSVLVLIAKATGRSYDMGRALLVAASLMVLENPSILLFDPSFQLSFLAALGLIFISPILERRILFFKGSPMFREILISTLATQILVLPLLLYQTGMVSLISLPANLLVLPLIPLTMFLGFVTGVVALLLPSLGFIVALPAYILLAWILLVAKTASLIPFATLHTGSISPYVVFVLYLLLMIFIRNEQMIITTVRKFMNRPSVVQRVPPSN